MDWLIEIGWTWLESIEYFGYLAAAFALLSRLMPCNPEMFWWRDLRAVATDLVYWFLLPLVSYFGRFALLVSSLWLLHRNSGPIGFFPIDRWSMWRQCALILVIQDIFLYWMHRAFHGRWGWRFHAVHHSPRVLDWLSLTRFHPVNNLAAFAVADVLVVLIGFSPDAVVALGPFNLVYSAMVHANLNWTFGPLRYLFASPVFHRWHHTLLAEGRDKNFAPTFPLLDLLFGTFYMPRGRLPEHFGVDEENFPQGFWGQMIHPFRRH